MIKTALRLSVSLTLATLSMQNTYDPATGAEMAKLAFASYCDNNSLQGMACGQNCDGLSNYQYMGQYFTTVGDTSSDSDSDDTDIESFSYSLFENTVSKRLVISFRGTSSKDQLIHEGMESKAITYPKYNIQNAVVTDYFYKKYSKYLQGDFIPYIIGLFENHGTDFDYYITGHSLGGAFATLAVLDVFYGANIPKENIHLYTYGCPRVGDINLAQAVVNSVGELWRVTHYKDLVPHVPPCIEDLEGNCVAWADHVSENGFLTYNAWHVWPEVYYNEDFSSYKICEKAEDSTCSDQWLTVETDVPDHLAYLGASSRSCPIGAQTEEEDMFLLY